VSEPSTGLLIVSAIIAVAILVLFVRVIMSVWRARKIDNALRLAGKDKVGVIVTDAALLKQFFESNESTWLMIAIVGLVLAYGFGSLGGAVTAILSLV